jgi:hypothetical protein
MSLQGNAPTYLSGVCDYTRWFGEINEIIYLTCSSCIINQDGLKALAPESHQRRTKE